MDNSKRIGIMTFFRVNNYGAVLQAYGLSTTLSRMGHDVEIIDYECPYLEKPYGMQSFNQKGLISYLMGLFGYLTRLPRNKKFAKFRSEFLNISKEKYDKEGFHELPYDALIVGSDQIWNLNATNGDTAYLLEGVSDNPLKYAYAASFGTSDIDSKWEKTFQKNLSRFSGITVREEETVPIIKRLLPEMNCKSVIDPVFLIDADEWKNISVKPQKTSYVLVYQQSITGTVVRIAQHLAKEKGLSICFIPFPMGKIAFGKFKTNYSPQEWLGLINGAEYVVTDSFHGVALSIIMNKKFFVSLAGVSHKTGGRIKGLLQKFGLEDRYIAKGQKIKCNDRDIDFSKVNEEIKKEQEVAIDYLKMIG